VAVVKARMYKLGSVIFKFLYPAKLSTPKLKSNFNGVKILAGTELNFVMLFICKFTKFTSLRKTFLVGFDILLLIILRSVKLAMSRIHRKFVSKLLSAYNLWTVKFVLLHMILRHLFRHLIS